MRAAGDIYSTFPLHPPTAWLIASQGRRNSRNTAVQASSPPAFAGAKSRGSRIFETGGFENLKGNEMDEFTIERQIRQARRQAGNASQAEVMRIALERMGHDISQAEAERIAGMRRDMADAVENVLDGIRNNALAKIATILATRANPF